MPEPRRLLVVRNITRDGPGLYETAWRERKVSAVEVDLSLGEMIPDPTEYAAMLVLGGPASANDTTGTMLIELDAVRRAVGADIPYFGSCLGHQVLVKALGGQVVKAGVREAGWRDKAGRRFELVPTPEGQTDPLFSGLHFPWEVFQHHGEEVRPTPAMTVLATGAGTNVQVVRAGPRAWGIQAHVEMTPEMLAAWRGEMKDLQAIPDAVYAADHADIRAGYEANAKQLFYNFLTQAGW